MLREIRQAILFNIVAMLLLGGVYPLVLWSVGAVAFRAQADGSLLRRPDGSVVGSRLIAQPFERPDYFQPRPSAVNFDAAGSGGSNLGPSNPGLAKAVADRLAAVRAREGEEAGPVPSELVTASASGLDPHIPPAAAVLQAARVARARGVAIERVSALIDEHSEPPLLGFLGRARVNVLELNLALDAAFGPPRVEAGR